MGTRDRRGGSSGRPSPLWRWTDRLGLTESDRRLRPWWTYLVLCAVMAAICGGVLLDDARRSGFLAAITGVLAITMGALAAVSFRRTHPR